MQSKSTWNWHFTSARETAHGTVEAVDPRDALSRALTSSTPTGRLLGEVHCIPVAVLDVAPANFDDRYELAGDGYTFLLERAAG